MKIFRYWAKPNRKEASAASITGKALSVLAAVVLLCGLAPGIAQSDDASTVRVGVMDAMTMSPLFIAAAKGYFKDEGLDVKFVQFDSATNMIAPLGQGRLDVGAGAPSAGYYNSVARGIDVRVVAALGNDPVGYGFEQLLVRTDLIKSGRYKSIKDLKGLRIAVNTLGAASTVAMYRLLDKAGLKLADVKQVFLPFPQHPVAFQNGSIDASVMAEPTATLTANTGAATRVAGADSWYPDQQIGTLFYGSNLTHAHRDIGTKFMRAYIRGVRYYNDALAGGKMAGPASEEVIKILTQRSMIHDPAIYHAVTPNGVDPNGKLNLRSMRDDLAFYKAQNLIEGNVDIDMAVDGGFLTDAIKSLPAYTKAR